jgi:solute carrier family 25 carnitine/acylcarnitine transporter 20/29
MHMVHAGAAGVLAGHPLDTVKVKIQTSAPGTYRGTWSCLASIAAKEGTRGLYAGIKSPLLGVAGINAITFGINAQVAFNSEYTWYKYYNCSTWAQS